VKKGGSFISDNKISEDYEIIQEVLNGNVNAFEGLVKKYEKMIYSLALSKLGNNRENAQDLTQECFLRAYKMLHSYRVDAAFSTWIYRICQNLIYDFYRANKNKRTAEVSLYIQDDGDEAAEREIADSSGEPSEIILREEKIRKIRELIQSLPDDLRDIIIMRDINNLSYGEIAESLDIEIGTVKSRLSRAREKLKKYILENNKDGELF
jgi:RNA polymerase sigma-70 factor (ECF subfamily)